MKNFLNNVLATMVGVVLIGVFISIVALVSVIGIAISGGSDETVSDKSVLRISLNGSIAERGGDENPFVELVGNEVAETQGLDDLLAAIRVAKDKDEIRGIYLEGGNLMADYAQLEELRAAICDFKSCGKFVYAYADNYTQASYYIASAADRVNLNPSGMLDWHGVASQPIFFKDLLEKVGVKMQVFKVGTYKSAVEPFILTEMSDANRQQVESYIGSIWKNICKDVAKSRRVSVDSLNAYADNYISFVDAKDYRRMKLVDDIKYIDGVRDDLRKLADVDEVCFVKPQELAKLDTRTDGKDEVAVYYAEGSIVDEASSTGLNTESEIVGSKVVRDLDELMNNDDVKAVVLRINSGGGSAYASEQMWRAIQQLKAKKPVVVSMSGMAASGGYYMSCGANYIFADPTTLTGSIGIFGMIPDMSGLMTDKLGLHFDVVKTNEAADFGAMGRPFNLREGNAMQQYVNRGYKLFLSRVAAGRKMSVEAVDKIGQGRVWTGEQALKIKLVDKLGNLDEAIAYAAKLAKVEGYAITAYPAKSTWFENLIAEKTKDDYLEAKLRTTLGVYYEPLAAIRSIERGSILQARVPYTFNLK